MISTVTTLTAQKAHDKGLEFLADLPQSVPQNLVGDPLRLGQILTNLVNNAVKFTEHGEIRLKAELVERNGDKVQLQIADKVRIDVSKAAIGGYQGQPPVVESSNP